MKLTVRCTPATPDPLLPSPRFPSYLRTFLTRPCICFRSQTSSPSATEEHRRGPHVRRSFGRRRGSTRSPSRAIASASISSPSWYDSPPPLSRRTRVRATPAMAPPRAGVRRRTAPPVRLFLSRPSDLDPMDVDRIDLERPFYFRSNGSRSRSAANRYRPIRSRRVASLIFYFG